MKVSIIKWLSLSFIFIGLQSLTAKVVSFNEENFSIEVPDDFVELSNSAAGTLYSGERDVNGCTETVLAKHSVK